MEPLERILIVGCGDIGLRLGRLARERGIAVGGVTRSEGRAHALAQAGIAAQVVDLDDADRRADLFLAGATVFYLVPPPGGGFRDSRARRFCELMTGGAAPRRLVYLGTSGVYGASGPAPVAEDAPVAPVTSRARRRLDAEETFRAWGAERQVAVVTLRIANIYGPGRLPVYHLQTRHPLLAEDDSRPTSRVHSDDLARACLALAQRAPAGEVINVCDNEPTSNTAYFAAVARMLGLPCPPRLPLVAARREMKPLLFSNFTESRILNNDKLLNVFGFELRYPTLQSGLAASLPDSA